MWQRSGARSLREALLLAYVLRDGKRYVSQADWLRQLLAEFAASPEKNFLAEAWRLLGGALRRLGAAQEAVEAFLQSIALEPDPEQKLVECSNAIFAANAVSGDSCELFHKLYAKYQELLDALHVVSYPKPSWHHEKIRVGYLSADLRDHAVAQFVQPLFQQYDANRFEVYVYSLVPQPDPVTEALRQSPVIWRDVAHIASFGALAERIRADENRVFQQHGHPADGWVFDRCILLAGGVVAVFCRAAAAPAAQPLLLCAVFAVPGYRGIGGGSAGAYHVWLFQ